MGDKKKFRQILAVRCADHPGKPVGVAARPVRRPALPFPSFHFTAESPVVPRRLLVPLAPEHVQRRDETQAGLAGFDHVVHGALGSGDVGVGDGVPVILGAGLRIVGLGDLLSEEFLEKLSRAQLKLVAPEPHD